MAKGGYLTASATLVQAGARMTPERRIYGGGRGPQQTLSRPAARSMPTSLHVPASVAPPALALMSATRILALQQRSDASSSLV